MPPGLGVLDRPLFRSTTTTMRSVVFSCPELLMRHIVQCSTMHCAALQCSAVHSSAIYTRPSINSMARKLAHAPRIECVSFAVSSLAISADVDCWLRSGVPPQFLWSERRLRGSRRLQGRSHTRFSIESKVHRAQLVWMCNLVYGGLDQ